MNCYKLIIAYDGRNYAGWQIQPNGISIQEMIENKMTIILKKNVKIRGSGRTDAKVHAENQVAHFHFDEKIDKRRFLHSLNSLLPLDIRIKSIEEMPIDFHAQYSAKGKIYHYYIHLNSVSSPFNYHYRWHVHYLLDLEKLKQAASLFLGTHDFTSFANEADEGVAAFDAVRTITRIDMVEIEGGIRLEFEGDGFLYKMVRNMTGFLVDIARGKRDISEIEQVFAAKDRRKAGQAAPSDGLFLMQVKY